MCIAVVGQRTGLVQQESNFDRVAVRFLPPSGRPLRRPEIVSGCGITSVWCTNRLNTALACAGSREKAQSKCPDYKFACHLSHTFLLEGRAISARDFATSAPRRRVSCDKASTRLGGGVFLLSRRSIRPPIPMITRESVMTAPPAVLICPCPGPGLTSPPGPASV